MFPGGLCLCVVRGLQRPWRFGQEGFGLYGDLSLARGALWCTRRFGLYEDLSPILGPPLQAGLVYMGTCRLVRPSAGRPPAQTCIPKSGGGASSACRRPLLRAGAGVGEGRGAAQGCVAHARCWELQVDSSRRVALGTGLTASDLEFGACWLVASLGGLMRVFVGEASIVIRLHART